MRYSTEIICGAALLGLMLKSPSLAEEITSTTEINHVEPSVYSDAKSLYVWAYPMVNLHNRRMTYVWGNAMVNYHRQRLFVSFSKSKTAPQPSPNSPLNRLKMQTDYLNPEQRFIVCPNQDVTYGIGFLDLAKSPVVVQVPAFGKRYWSIELMDQRSDVFASPGIRNNTTPGHYLVVGPNWKGEAPEGIVDVFHSPTRHAIIIPRVFLDDTTADREAIQPVLNQIMSYPVAEYTGEMRVTDWQQDPMYPKFKGKSEVKWVRPENFWQQLPAVLDEVPPMEGEQSLYLQARQLIKLYKSHAKIRKQLKQAVKDAEQDIVAPMFQLKNVGQSFGNGWFGAINGAKFGTDYLNRTAVAKSYMMVNLPEDALYLGADDDANGVQLNGNADYQITFPADQLPPVNGFWSLTVYDKFHFFAPNTINRYSLGTKNKSLKYNADGSLTLYLQHKAPTDVALHANWLPVPNDDFGLMLRLFLAQESVLNQTWHPPAIKKSS